MALQINYNSEYGVAFNDAYVRIKHTEVRTPVDDDSNRLTVQLEIFASNQARLDGAQPIGNTQASDGEYDETSSLSKADLYAWLKTQPGFEGAIDV